MFRRVMASLNWETTTDRDTFADNLSAELSGISTYDENVNHYEDNEGTPRSTVDVRPESTTDADDLYTFISDEMDSIPASKGRVHWHDCKHDEGRRSSLA